MFDEQDLIGNFQAEAQQKGAMERIKSLDSWLRALISVCAFVVAGYTAAHGISATLQFRAHGTMGTITGIAGVVVLEVMFLIISHGLIHGTFKGSYTHLGFMWAAAGIALVFILLNTVVDAQLNQATEMLAREKAAAAAAALAATGGDAAAAESAAATLQQAQSAAAALSRNLAFYFQFIMPISSVVVVVLALVGLYFAPESARERARGKQVYDYEETVFSAYLAAKGAELQTTKIIGNAQLSAKMNAAKLAAGAFNSAEVQGAIQRSALGSVPALLRSIGVTPDQIPDGNGNGRFDLEDVAAYLEERPDLAARLFGQARRRDEADATTVEIIRDAATGANVAGVELVEDEGAGAAVAGLAETFGEIADALRSAKQATENLTHRPGDGR